MSETTDLHTVAVDVGGLTLTRLETATVIGSVLSIISLVLPWASGLSGPVLGFEFTWLSPGFVAAAVIAIALAVFDPHSRIRYAITAIIGVALAAIGVILLLGVSSYAIYAGVGLVVFVIGGLLVTAGGYTALIRETSTMKATGVVCAGALAVLVVGIVAAQVA